MSDTAKVKPAVTIMLDKERHLKLTLSGMIAFQEATGKNLLDPKVAQALGESASLADLRALLWACLRHEDRSLTLEQAGDLIDAANMVEITSQLSDAFINSMPAGGKEEANKTDPP